MIEQNIIEWLELGDSIQKIELYSKKSVFFYKMNYLLSQFSHFSEFYYFLIIFIFFMQICEINISKIDIKGDRILNIIIYFENFFLFQKTIKSHIIYILFIILIVIFYSSAIILSILTMIIYTKKGIKKELLITFNSIINLLNVYYINGPSIQILLFTFFCQDSNNLHSFVCPIKSFWSFIKIFIILLFIIFIILAILTAAQYINDIGCINGSDVRCKINNNYTPIIIIVKMIYFLFHFFIEQFIFEKNSYQDFKILLFIYYFFIMIFNILMSIYTYKELFYYNKSINYCIHFGWYYTTWLSVCIFFKYIAKIKDITLFIFLGFIIITLGFYFKYNQNYFKLITEFNFFEANDLKKIEIYNHILLDLLNKEDHKSKILISGIIKRFEEYISNNSESNELYNKLLKDKHLQIKFTSKNELSVLAIIYMIYFYNIEKSKNIIDISLNMCYFLINRFKNPVFAIWLCSKLKYCNNMQSYYLYVLMEEIKDYLMAKINKNSKKNSIKYVQISTAILYYQYVELFKIKIYDATCSQIEYFDIFRNKIITNKTIDNYLAAGDDVLNLRKEVLNLWEKIILINPFSEESAKDFLLYIGFVLKDDILVKREEKKFNEIQVEKLPEKNNSYYSIFDKEITTVLLADGYSYNGKIIYTTPNFQSLFMLSGKEIINTTIDDLLPDSIQNFHRFLIEDGIKHSNLGYIFKGKKDVFLKGKNGMIFNVHVFIKPVPNLYYGLIFFIYLQKNIEQNFILILDDNFIIDGFTKSYQIDSNLDLNKSNYELTNDVKGHHIGLIIPEILLQLDYDLKSNNFKLHKNSIDLKGYLYPISEFKELDEKIQIILNSLKKRKMMDDNKRQEFEEYNELIKYLNKKNSNPYSIFFRIESHIFVGGKYKYYRIYITKDLLVGNETILSNQSNERSVNNKNSKADLKQTIMSKIRLKELFDDDNSNSNNQKQKKNKDIKIMNMKNGFNKLDKKLNKEEIQNNEDPNIKNNTNQISSFNTNRNKNLDFNSLYSNSSINNSNAEPVVFNKIKGFILKKTDCYHVKKIMYLSYAFIPINIILIIFEYLNISYGINRMIEFIHENKYFTHVKICSASAYISAINIKLVKEGHIHKKICPNTNCSTFYFEILKKSLDEIILQKSNISLYFSDFQDIFEKNNDTGLFIYNSTEKDNYPLDMNNFLNLIIVHGMKIISNLIEYYDESNNYDNEIIIFIDTYIKNLIENSFKYFQSDYSNFVDEEKEKKTYKIALYIPISLCIYFIFLAFMSYIYYSYIILIKDIHIFYFDKLMNFYSPGFEKYLKKINEIKKKFKNDSNDTKEEEDEKNTDEFDLKDENENSKIKTNKNEEIIDERNSKKKKQIKIQQQKIKNKKIISNYLFKINVIKIIKFGIIFILSTFYYISSIFITKKLKKNYLEFDSIIEQINTVYFEYFKIFLTFKNQLEIYDTTNNLSEIYIPEDSEIVRPKLGNSLMYIIKSNKYSKENKKMFEMIYNDNACKILTENEEKFKICENILSSIITKGLEQSMVHLSNIISSIIDELNGLKIDKTLNDIYNENTLYSEYEVFMEYYMFLAFLKTQKIFETFMNDEKIFIFNICKLTLLFFFIFYIILFIILIVNIFSYQKFTRGFLSFIGIVPSKYMIDDNEFYQQVIGLDPFF